MLQVSESWAEVGKGKGNQSSDSTCWFSVNSDFDEESLASFLDKAVVGVRDNILLIIPEKDDE